MSDLPETLPPSLAERTWRWIRRVVLLVIGVPITLAGLVLLVTPGPGIPVLIGGLAILAIEFTWARNRLHDVRRGARRVVEGRPRTAGPPQSEHGEP